MNTLKKFFESILDFIYPPICLLCGERTEGDRQICPDCWDKFLDTLKLNFQKYKKDFHHLTGEIFFDEMVTCWTYTSEIEKLIHRVKYQRGKKLAILLGRTAGKNLQQVFKGWDDTLIIPVPLHRVRQRERGYNQSELLCQGLAAHIPVPISSDLLFRHRNTPSQTKLTAQERHENVKDAFTIRQPDRLAGKKIILVDDVSTTGATMNSCASCLKKAGAEKVIGIALARPQFE